jgi:hypothetical protein
MGVSHKLAPTKKSEQNHRTILGRASVEIEVFRRGKFGSHSFDFGSPSFGSADPSRPLSSCGFGSPSFGSTSFGSADPCRPHSYGCFDSPCFGSADSYCPHSSGCFGFTPLDISNFGRDFFPRSTLVFGSSVFGSSDFGAQTSPFPPSIPKYQGSTKPTLFS